jgi:hypothetical protein
MFYRMHHKEEKNQLYGTSIIRLSACCLLSSDRAVTAVGDKHRPMGKGCRRPIGRLVK